MARAFDRLGWHWWPADSYVNTTPYKQGREACNYCGPLNLGCVRKAKARADITYWPLALELGVELRTRSRVYEITSGPDGRVTGASYFDGRGVARHQPARAVIAACNGIGTPRLLLLSRSDSHPAGLANGSGQVGKNLMFHVIAHVTAVFDEDLKSYRGPGANILLSHEFYETAPRRDYVRGYQLQMVRGSGPASTAVGRMMQAVPWGKQHHDLFAARFGRTTAFAVTAEDLPEETNMVDLDPELTDGSGIPAPRVRYRIGENTRRILDHGIGSAKRVFAEAGAKHVETMPLAPADGVHLLGTARMGDDPGTSVVDRWGQAHDADNLFVIDGSVFVTSGAVNPTPHHPGYSAPDGRLHNPRAPGFEGWVIGDESAIMVRQMLVSSCMMQQRRQVFARHVARQPHTAMASSLTKCNLTTIVSCSSPKWHSTASLTIDFRSTQSSPCVKMLWPRARASKPPSTASVTSKMISFGAPMFSPMLTALVIPCT